MFNPNLGFYMKWNVRSDKKCSFFFFLCGERGHNSWSTLYKKMIGGGIKQQQGEGHGGGGGGCAMIKHVGKRRKLGRLVFHTSVTVLQCLLKNTSEEEEFGRDSTRCLSA